MLIFPLVSAVSMTSVAPIDCLYLTLNPLAFSAWL